MTKREVSDEFLRTGRNSDLWILRAEQNLYVAHVVWRRYEELSKSRPHEEKERIEEAGCFLAAMLHAGLALELSAKAVLVARNPSIFTASGLEGGEFKSKGGHDLVSLVEKALSTIAAEEGELLRRLTEAILWTSRYPTPKNEKFMAMAKRLTIPTDLRLTKGLFQRLRDCAKRESQVASD